MDIIVEITDIPESWKDIIVFCGLLNGIDSIALLVRFGQEDLGQVIMIDTSAFFAVVGGIVPARLMAVVWRLG